MEKRELAPLQELIDRFSDVAAAGRRREAKQAQFEKLAQQSQDSSRHGSSGVNHVHLRSRSMVHHQEGSASSSPSFLSPKRIDEEPSPFPADSASK